MDTLQNIACLGVGLFIGAMGGLAIGVQLAEYFYNNNDKEIK
jgi:hypothetical protein